MKKTLATLLVAGALATAGMSASAAISAAADTSGQSSVGRYRLVAGLHQEVTETALTGGGCRK